MKAHEEPERVPQPRSIGRRRLAARSLSTRGSVIVASTVAIAAAIVAVAAAVSVLANGSGSKADRSGPSQTHARVDLGAIWGRAFQGRAPAYESLPRAESDANRIPPGATVDRATGTIRFQTTTASITIVANPPNGRDMAFRAAGLENPTIEVRPGTRLIVRFINADSDSAHGWLLLDPVVQVGNSFHGPRAFPGSFAPILGDPTTAGQPLETIRFTASQPGTYRYECPVPGHAAMGMQGELLVST
jgi:plastocyanin